MDINVTHLAAVIFLILILLILVANYSTTEENPFQKTKNSIQEKGSFFVSKELITYAKSWNADNLDVNSLTIEGCELSRLSDTRWSIDLGGC